MRRVFIGLAIVAASSLLPAWTMAGDVETAQKVAGNLKYSGRLKGYAIDVKAKDGVIVLVGKVASEEQAQAAIEVAKQTPGVDRVVPQLTIPEPAPLPQPKKMTLQQPASPQPQGEEEPLSARRVPQPVAGRSGNGFPTYDAGQVPQVPSPAQYDAPTPQDAAQLPTPARYETPAAGNQNFAAARSGPMTMAGPRPLAYAAQPRPMAQGGMPMGPQPAPMGEPIPAYAPGTGGGVAPAHYDHANMPNYAWPSYAAYPNYAALTYPKQYSASAWPFIGPFYPYPQVPLGWRKVSLEWDDGWWFLDFDDKHCHHR